MLDFLTYSVPWWVWTVPAAATAIGALLALSRVVGLRNAAQWVIAASMGLIALLVHHRGKQAGWQARGEKGKTDVENFVQKADEARAAARDRNDAGGLREDDGFKRRDL